MYSRPYFYSFHHIIFRTPTLAMKTFNLLLVFLIDQKLNVLDTQEKIKTYDLNELRMTSQSKMGLYIIM